MFARIMAVVLTVILLLTVVLSGIGWITLKDQQTETVMDTLRTEAREIAYLAAQRTDSIDLGFFGHTRSNKNTYLQWKANEVYEVWKSQGKEGGDALGAEYGFTSSYQARAIRSRASMGPTIAMEMNTFCIGDIGLTPGTYEMFSTNALFVKENSPFETTFLLSGTSTYMPAAIAYTYRGYEQDTTFYAAGSAEIMADQYVLMLKELKGN